MFNKIIRYIKAKIATNAIAKKQAGWRDAVRAVEIALIKKYPQPVIGPFVDFPNFNTVLSERRGWFADYISSGAAAKAKRKIVMIGDSIGDGSRDWLFNVDTRMNLCKGGMWIHHMSAIYHGMKPLWDAAKFVPDVIIVVTPGGNNLLQRQDVNNVILQFIELLDTIRNDYRGTRIIIGDLPSSIVAYVIANKSHVSSALLDWCRKDGNACLLLFIKNFVAYNKMLPKNYESIEGVHFTPLGAITFDDELGLAMDSKMRIVIP